MYDHQRKMKEEIIKIGQRLYAQGLAVAKSGNLSCRLDGEHILITASGTRLGELDYDDIVKVNFSSGEAADGKKPSSELPLHSLIYKNFPSKAVIHAHPPLTNGYFAVCDTLEALTFETRFYLGNVPCIKQETPTVTQPDQVIDALKANRLVVLKNHGIVAMADKFDDALELVEALEEAVKTAAVARIFSQGAVAVKQQNAEAAASNDVAYEIFSRQHIQAIVDLVNKDPFIAQKGQELDLTVQLAIKMEGAQDAFKFNFEKGKIVRLDFDDNAPFVISAPAATWEQVFHGKLDSFVAVTQGKMHLKGELGKLSRWYVPFTRLFELFKQVKIK